MLYQPGSKDKVRQSQLDAETAAGMDETKRWEVKGTDTAKSSPNATVAFQ